MLKKRIIPTILTDGSSQVKGTNFNSWRTVGSVLTAAKVFSRRDVDELVLLDVSATKFNRIISPELVNQLAEFLRIPFAVGGGVSTLGEIELLLAAGADKVVIGTSFIENPKLITQASEAFGKQAIVCSVDSGTEGGKFCFTKSGEIKIDKSAKNLASLAEKSGAGEILLQSVWRDGTMEGFDKALIREVCSEVSIPVMVSGGAGQVRDYLNAIELGASAVCAGAIFQFTSCTPSEVRDFLRSNNVPVRL
jgi:cyclase